MGYFKHTDLKRILNQVYTNILTVYKAHTPAHLRLPDHIPLILIPMYTLWVRIERTAVKTVQDYFDQRNWELFAGESYVKKLCLFSLGVHRVLY